jgi:hypothetical protein
MVFASRYTFRSRRKFIAKSASKNTFVVSIISMIESKIIGRIISMIAIASQSTNKIAIIGWTRNMSDAFPSSLIDSNVSLG